MLSLNKNIAGVDVLITSNTQGSLFKRFIYLYIFNLRIFSFYMPVNLYFLLTDGIRFILFLTYRFNLRISSNFSIKLFDLDSFYTGV